MKIRFTVIDDAAFLRELIKNIMSSAGHICVGEAENGNDGIRLVSSVLPDLVFLDMVMPLRNGLESARAIKESHPDIMIIGCSTIDSDAMIEKAHEAGFDAYITKPFTKENLLMVVSKVLPQAGESTHGRT
ncbi:MULTISPECIES: response regulator [unclassified Bdellovibrio]|uniref:response regulator n=1 Tax=unclassified Bdellovibrio TaxID=2633795 RepID=UPI00115A7C9E|nr:MULTISPECIES: response regulator [unclassified Bdellovibrio]QDK43766.1 response regulator [Bdellovibrio sp. ZAP7]QLY25587.1 response regulator [Bdellovibrio sp. KM01]